MSKIIDNGKIRNSLGENFIENSNKFFYKDSDLIYDIKLYPIKCGIYYMDSKISMNTEISFNEIFNKDYHFLYFNSSNTKAICYQKNKKFILQPNEILTITMLRNFRYKVRYDNKFYNIQAIMLDTDLIKEFNIFQNLKPVLDNFLIKSNPTSKAQTIILNDLKNADIYSGKLKEIFVESKVLELIFSICANSNLVENKTLTKAKEILLKNLANPPSIEELAKMCSTNRFSLQENFKKQFNNTIYGYLKDERLKVAFELLKRDDINVSEAAKMVGYGSLSHFTKIFKEKYKTLPSKIR